jgi:hypothetical protein
LDLSPEYVVGSADRAVLSRFDASYLWGGFSDRNHACIVLSFSTMSEMKNALDWARERSGIAAAEVDLMTDLTCVLRTFRELLGSKRLQAASLAN